MKVTPTEIALAHANSQKGIDIATEEGREARLEDRVLVQLAGEIHLHPVFCPVRPEVMQFAYLMEARLREKDNERLANWKNKNASALCVDMMSKAMILDHSAITGNKDAVMKHAVDLANYAMFVFDVTTAHKAEAVAG